MKVLVVADTKIASGMHYNLLAQVLKANGCTKWDVVAIGSDKPKIADCLAKTDEILNVAQKGYDRILPTSGGALAAIYSLPKVPPITKYRGKGMHAPTGHFLVPTISPSTCIKDPEFFRDLVFDVSKLCAQDAPLPQPEVETIVLEKKKDLALLKDLHDASFISCDIETTGFNPVTSDILSIGLGALTHDDDAYVLCIPDYLIGEREDPLCKFLRSYKGTTVFHNGKFDVQHLWHRWGRFDFADFADTMLLGWVLDERPFNRYKHLSLKKLASTRLDAPDYDIDMGSWLEEWFREDPDPADVNKYLVEYVLAHPEKARTYWREANPDEEWRGKKVGRDIHLEDVYPCIPLPKHLLPAPTPARKKEMWDQMLQYMAYDCSYTARLYPLLKQEAYDESPRLLNVLETTLYPASLALANMEMQGTHLDVKYLTRTRKEIAKQLEEEMVEIRALVAEHTTTDAQEFNPNSPSQVATLLYGGPEDGGLGLKMPKDAGRYAYKREEGQVTTNADTLKVLARQVAPKMPAASKLITKIIEFRVKSKIASTYIDSLLNLMDHDERIRGDFNLHGTSTGRLSCSEPNLQNIPDASHVGFDIRRAYIPTPGWRILEADYSQLELRVAGLFSQDQVLIDAYRNGADIHQEVAYMLWKKPKDQITKYERYLAKCMNFGVLYGRGPRSLATGPEMDNLVEQSGRSWSEKEIMTYFNKFKEGYSELFAWMDLIKAEQFAVKYVEGPLGNRRRFPLVLKNEDRARVERQIVNTPIQGFAAQLTLRALVELDRAFDPEIQRLLFTVHDSIMCECVDDPEIVRDTAELIRTTMENILPEDAIVSFPVLDHAEQAEGEPINFNIPFVADVHCGLSWGDCEDDPWELPARPRSRASGRSARAAA
jgi:DNA polymerase I-like protein with 3'-5' exonuclease and polymerase domains